MKNNLVVVGLNEINFDYINAYIKQGKLPFLKQLLNENKLIQTTSEKEHRLLEPWIQWVTVQTGKSYAEHQVLRLGDITNRKDLTQIFEKVEKKGRSVGAVSPFNADNRLQNANFFVPDPWTETRVNGNWLVSRLSEAISQAVNDNAQSKLSIKSISAILLSFLFFVPLSRIFSHYFKLALNKNKAGTKAIILDSLLSDVFIKLLKRKKTEFSWLFLNSGAHIQHHYLFNSAIYEGDLKNPSWYCEEGHDPLLSILEEYDRVLALINKQNVRLLILTGLHQQPHKHMTFYWRLKAHEAFIKKIKIQNTTKLLPRMSRDFLVEFANEFDSKAAEDILTSFKSTKDNMKIFAVDNRGTSLFVELVYPNDIDEDFSIISESVGIVEHFKEYIAFVAIKNGEHNGIGYVTSNFDLHLEDKVELATIHDKILEVA